MVNPQNNVAYIDGANLYNAMTDLGWKIDYTKLRVWLREKYGVQQAYLFLGLMPKYKDMYTNLQEQGYTLVFKEVIYQGGKPKGNCDADIVVKAMEDAFENTYQKAVLITSDGDYSSLVKFLWGKGKFETILSPAIEEKCSILLKRTNASIVYINDKRSILEYTHVPKNTH